MVLPCLPLASVPEPRRVALVEPSRKRPTSGEAKGDEDEVEWRGLEGGDWCVVVEAASKGNGKEGRSSGPGRARRMDEREKLWLEDEGGIRLEKGRRLTLEVEDEDEAEEDEKVGEGGSRALATVGVRASD